MLNSSFFWQYQIHRNEYQCERIVYPRQRSPMNGINFADKLEELRSRVDDLQQRLADNTKSNQIEPILNGLKDCLADLQNEEQKQRNFAENAPFGIALIDKDGTFSYINPKFKDMFGYDLSDIPCGREWFRKTYPDPIYRHEVISAWIKDLKGSKPGEKRPRIFTVTCKGDNKKIIRFVAVQQQDGGDLISCEDVTESRQAEEALRKSEQEKAAVLNGLKNVAVQYLDPQMRIIWLNTAVQKFLGLSEDELRGRHCYELIQGLEEPCPCCTVVKALQISQSQEGELVTPDGKT
jgi:PAS domain S-box-containing protein